MKTSICTKINDPGHGWLKVEKSFLKQLGIENKISSYSYQKGFFAYLEEDCDMEIFLVAARGQGYEISVHDTFTKNNADAECRKFPCY